MDKSQPTLINQNLIVILLILQFFFSAYLFFKLNTLAKGGVNVANAAAPAADNAAAPAAGGEPTQNLAAMPEVTEKDHIRGNRDADVILVEYSDLECPFCKTFHETMIQVREEYGDRVAWVYRHYPLSFHPKAQKSAEAVECAAEQGGDDAFWSMSDAIFERMPDIEVSAYADLANELGLNGAALQECMDSGKYAEKVKTDMDGGSLAGVSGTPGTIIVGKNGKRDFIGGAYPLEEVKTKIDAVLK